MTLICIKRVIALMNQSRGLETGVPVFQMSYNQDLQQKCIFKPNIILT